MTDAPKPTGQPQAAGDDMTSVVDTEALRALRAAQWPGLPEATVAAPILVGHLGAEAAQDSETGNGQHLADTAAWNSSAVIEATAPPAPLVMPGEGDTRLSGASAPISTAWRRAPEPDANAAALGVRDTPALPTSQAPEGLRVELAGDAAAPLSPSPSLVAAEEAPSPPPLLPEPEEPRPVADAPRLMVQAAMTNEDTPVALVIEAALDDRDGLGGETLSILVTGLPPGATLSAGAALGNGAWLLMPANLPGLMFVPGQDWSGDVELTVRAIVRTDDGDEATTVASLAVSVEAVADAPAVSAGGQGIEDSAIALGASVSAVDVDGSETITAVTLLGVPADATLSAGTREADGSWTLTQDQLAGLTLTPPPHYAGSIALSLVATSAEPNGSTATTRHDFTIEVTAVADAPTVMARDATGEEDQAIALSGLSAALVDTDGSETMQVMILGLPEGAVLSHGQQVAGGWLVAASDLAGLSLTPPRDFAGVIALTLRATATEGSNASTATSDVAFSVTVSPVVDGAALAAQAAGNEDQWITINAVIGQPQDASEAWAETMRITGVPEGASLNQGTDLGGGVWEVATADLAAGLVAIRPPANSDDDIALTITGEITDTAGDMVARESFSTDVTVHVAAVADAPVVAAADVTGAEDTWIGLAGLSASLVDTDGSETLSIAIAGVPAGAQLSAGAVDADGTWHIPPEALATLALLPPPHWSGSIALSVIATATEARGGAASTVAHLTVGVDPRADEGTIVAGADGREDSWIPLTATFATPDADGSERWAETTTISAVPLGAMLSQGTETMPGTWVVATAALQEGAISILPPRDSDVDFTLRIATTLIDSGNGREDVRLVEADAPVRIAAVADAPDVVAADAAGQEDHWIALPGLGGALSDTDGSESLSFRLSGLPAGARLSAGSRGADGTWTLTPEQLAGVSLLPPRHYAGALALTLTAVAMEGNDASNIATTATTFTVTVAPVADAGTITGTRTGMEDTWIAVKANFYTPDRDGSETWSVLSTISGVPAGATLSQGSEIAPGVWEVSTAALRAGDVSIRPPADSDDDISLTVSAVLSDTAAGMTSARDITGTVQVIVNAVADAPDVAAQDAAGAEDTWISLAGLSASLTDTDGSETLAVTIAGVPQGAVLSHGSLSGSVWHVNTADLATLALLPPRDFSGSIALTLTAIATEERGGSTAVSTVAFSVDVAGVADTPTVRVVAAIGGEDTAIALRLDGAATDRDGSETVTHFRIAAVPDGAVLATADGPVMMQPDGSYLVPAALAGSVTITPALNDSRDFVLAVSAIAAEPNGSTAESPPASLPVTVLAIADAPVNVGGGGSSDEDSTVSLNITGALADTDGSEVLSYIVSGVPAGMSLSAGTYAGPGRWSLTAEEAIGAALIVPKDYAGTVQLTLTAVAQETEGGSTATTTVPLRLDIVAVIDTPAVGGLGGTSARWPVARGDEDSPIALALDPGLSDSDGSERVVGTIMIGNVPEGAVLTLRDGTILTPEADGSYAVAAAQMGEVMVIPPPDSDVAFELTVSMTIEDTGGVRETIAGTLMVDPVGVADTPDLVVADASGDGPRGSDPADGHIPLAITATATDNDGSETVRVVLRDVPDGFVLSAGQNMGGGVWVLAPGQEEGLTIRPPTGFEGDVTLVVEAIAQEREGDTARVAQTLTLTVHDGGDGGAGDGGGGDGEGSGGGGADGGGDAGTAALAPPVLQFAASDGVEDEPFALNIAAAHGGGGVGEVSITYVVSGLPAGARLSAGFHDAATDRWLLSEGELGDLTVLPPADYAGPISFDITAVATDAIGNVATTRGEATATLAPVVDAPVIGAAPVAGREDEIVTLNLSAAPGDRDGSETITAVTISDIPAGARLTGAPVIDNGDGSFSVDPALLGLVNLVPPENAHGTFSLTVTVTAAESGTGETRSLSRSVSFTLDAVADAPSLAVDDAAGQEDTAIALSITAGLVDTDGSELLSIVISGLPEGAQLSAGINNGDGSWTLTPAQLTGLTLTPPADFSGTIAASVTAHALERSTGEAATTTVAMRIDVAGIADTPIVDAPGTREGVEDEPITVGLAASLRDRDGSETLSVVASNVPDGASFSAGTRNPDGTWQFTAAELTGLQVVPPPHFSGDMTIRFTVIAAESDGDTASVPADIVFTIAPVADAPELAVDAAGGDEDTVIALPITAALVDADGSEELVHIVLSGLPAGASLSAGVAQGDGSWVVAPDELAGLALLPPPNWSGTAQLVVTATAREIATGEQASTTRSLALTVVGVADAPMVQASASAGAEGTPIALSLSAALVDLDGSETLGDVVIAGLPDGFALSAGTAIGGGAWSVAPEALPGLMLIPPPRWHGTLNLSVTATSHEADGDSATASAGFMVVIAEVPHDPTLVVDAAAPVTAGVEAASLVAGAALSDPDGDAIVSAVVTLGQGRQPGDGIAVSGFALHPDGNDLLIGETGIRIIGGGFDEATGTFALTGAAAPETYAEVIGALVLVGADGGPLEAGDRDVTIALHDAAGDHTIEALTVSVVPSVITGDGSGGVLDGTGAADTFIGSSADETMHGGAGNDLFLIEAGGGHDTIDGGAGFDTLMLGGVSGPPSAGPPTGQAWTLVLDTPGQAIEGEGSLDFSEPAAGRIVFGDGTQVDFSNIERITW